MAVTTIGETLVHPFSMGGAMAISTGGNGAVLLGMAGGAGYVPMAGRTGGPFPPRLLVAGNTMVGRGRITVIKGGGHVRLMAETAIGFGHGRGMRCMARSASRFGPMRPRVAIGAGELGMAAWLFMQLFALQGMAGETDVPDIPLQLDIHWRVGVVTTSAAGQLVMRTPHMAKGASRNILFLLGTMPSMAFLTGDRRLVRHALPGNGQSLLDMALFAIGILQRHWTFCRRKSRTKSDREKNTEQNG